LERSQMVEQLFNTLRELNSGRGSENLQRHISFQDMKVVCQSLRASAVDYGDDELGLSDEEVQELRILKFIFKCCDVNGDGLVTSVELKSTCINYPEVAAFLGIEQEIQFVMFSECWIWIMTAALPGVNSSHSLRRIVTNAESASPTPC